MLTAQQALTNVPISVLILMVVLILERLLPISPNVHPLSFFKALALGISQKVHSNKRKSSIAQQKTAGILAIPTLILPIIFLLFVMSKAIEFPVVFDTLLLWMCLCWSPIKKSSNNIQKALVKNNKSLAKARLSPWVLRDTHNLSPMGLCKTTVEMMILRASKEYFAVILYFLLFGPLTMLFYRLMMILNQCWNPKLNHYRHFGQVTQWIGYLLEWLPNRLTTMTIMALHNIKLTRALIKQTEGWQNDNSLYLLAATAGGLKISLGGPAYYNQQKIRRPVIANTQTMEPDIKSIKQCGRLIEQVLVVWLLVIVLLTILRFTLVM